MKYTILPAFVVLLALSTIAMGQVTGAQPTSQPGELLAKITSQYLDGKWVELDKSLKTVDPKTAMALSAKDKADLAYIRLTFAECRPAWWDQCKGGERVQFRPTVWGSAINATFDPNAASSVQISASSAEQTMTLCWKIEDMDNNDQAEHGFTKGDLGCFNVWSTLGLALGYSATPAKLLTKPTEKDKMFFNRYLDFRSALTGIYYGTPKARRWGLWMSMWFYTDANSKGPMAENRKSIGSMFMLEVMGNPAKYPSISFPDKFPDDNIQQSLAEHFRGVIEKAPWTLPEDKTLRDAIRVFAAANDKDVLDKNKVVLTGNLQHMLDATEDTPYKTKREAWLKTLFQKASK